ncbi:MBL fold metallo-hydrolase [Salibacterium salarium]|uniref:MBL fold metallo-hydrolase n=1 Tax=Salibacterium salarium TaxID=284579 RepID=A0A428MVR2_9BACI|nr:MBL fold metallo-hydrolase [Salibacterium salarium]RSL30184.1 MBL fold metallo-hydrolase [Salibacterium salarium]
MKDKILPVTSIMNGSIQEVTNTLYSYTNQVVNVCFYRLSERSREWVLIDAGMPHSAEAIRKAVTKQFGSDHQPQAIILTHGHFDHVGAVEELAQDWNVPVYAHEKEMPYLTGKRDYPEPDTSVEGGWVAKMSKMFPNEGIHLGDRVQPLPEDGSVPEMQGWKWLHTPGHTPGHVSLFDEENRILIAGDAFVTVRQDSLFKVTMQTQEIHGPPRYLTTDWNAARQSVETLRDLNPKTAITGHGVPMGGNDLKEGLNQLVSHFDEVAIPDHGEYV